MNVMSLLLNVSILLRNIILIPKQFKESPWSIKNHQIYFVFLFGDFLVLFGFFFFLLFSFISNSIRLTFRVPTLIQTNSSIKVKCYNQLTGNI